jgi:FkbM family methyltransferase
MNKYLFKLLFNPFINNAYSRILRPFCNHLPDRMKIPVQCVFRLETGKTGVIRIKGNYTSYVTRQLFWNGMKGFEYDSSRLFMELAKRSKVFIDIGANFGYYSLLGKLANPGLHVIAFEPFPDALKALRANLSLNRIYDVQVEESGLFNTTGNAMMSYRINKDFPEILQLAGNNTLLQCSDDRTYRVQIGVERLDDYVNRKKIPPIDLIKIDTESTEHLILEGAFETLKKNRPVILTEVLAGGMNRDMTGILENLNYSSFGIRKHDIIKVKEFRSEGTESNFLIVPDEMKNAIEKIRF